MKYIITRCGRYGVITPMPSGKLSNMLNKQMSYIKQGAEFMPNPEWAKVKLYDVKKGKFPWGFRKLVKQIMFKWMEYSNETFEFEDSYGPIAVNNICDKQLRPYQINAVEELMFNNGGIVCLPTGGGKTRVAIEYIKQTGNDEDVLIVVHTNVLREQWENIIATNNLLCSVRTYQSLKKDKLNYKLVICDECHHVAAKSLYRVAMKCSNAILVGVSATPKREDGEDMRIQAALGEIVYTITRKELIEQGYLVDATVHYHALQPSREKYFVNYQEAYESYIVNNNERNMWIVELVYAEYLKGKKVLILCNYIKHMEYLYHLLIALNDAVTSRFINGQTNKKEQKKIVEDINSFNAPIVVFASTIFDEGVDFPGLDCVILAAGGKSSIKLTQRVGRILRPQKGKGTAIIHDFYDDCRWLREHSERRRQILSEDFKIIKE